MSADAALPPDSDDVAKWLKRNAAVTPCGCPLCVQHRAVRRIAEAVREIEEAEEVRLNTGEELGMSHAYLRDEVEAVLALPWWAPIRRRLRHALKVAAN